MFSLPSFRFQAPLVSTQAAPGPAFVTKKKPTYCTIMYKSRDTPRVDAQLLWRAPGAGAVLRFASIRLGITEEIEGIAMRLARRN
jgi:hypothetical protein